MLSAPPCSLGPPFTPLPSDSGRTDVQSRQDTCRHSWLPGSPWQPAEVPGSASASSHNRELTARTCLFIQTEKPAIQKEPSTPHTVKLRGAPFNVTEVCASSWDKDRELFLISRC